MVPVGTKSTLDEREHLFVPQLSRIDPRQPTFISPLLRRRDANDTSIPTKARTPMSWLSRFPNHRIFSLPLSTSTTDHDGDEHETSRQDGQSRRSLVDAPLDRRDGTLPTLNKLPSIFPPTSLARSARPSPTTPKFVAAASPASGGRNPRAPLAEANVSSRLGSLSDVGRGRVRERHVDRGRRNQRIVTIRGGTELIVAVGTELRIVNLKQVKVAAAAAAAAAARGGGRETRAHEEENDEDPDLGDYKVRKRERCVKRTRTLFCRK